mmetsp:Transcript_2160/g.6151  ORF Transcript_2160/g.6151 Transcript_2160/m.6151 type:complete len:87 (-) Transcript_2160:321-581(-)
MTRCLSKLENGAGLAYNIGDPGRAADADFAPLFGSFFLLYLDLSPGFREPLGLSAECTFGQTSPNRHQPERVTAAVQFLVLYRRGW